MSDIDRSLRDTLGRVTGGVFSGLTHEFPIAARAEADLARACRVAGGPAPLPIPGRQGGSLPLVRAWSFRGRWRARWWESSLWVHPQVRNYKAAWLRAAELGLVPFVDAEPILRREGWTQHGDFDLDHVFPKSWALAASPPFEWVRLYPVDRVVNRLTGSRWEGPALRQYRTERRRWPRIVYANELQIAKMMGHPTWHE